MQLSELLTSIIIVDRRLKQLNKAGIEAEEIHENLCEMLIGKYGHLYHEDGRIMRNGNNNFVVGSKLVTVSSTSGVTVSDVNVVPLGSGLLLEKK